MRRLAITTALVLLLALPGAASAATLYVIDGAGFGHGVGMSQYGAYGFAQHGFDHRAILAHYYTGTSLGRTPSRNIRVLLRTAPRLVVRAQEARGAGLKLVTYVATATPAGGLDLRDEHRRLFGHYTSAVAVASPQDQVTLAGVALNGVAGGAYRGRMELSAAGGSVSAVNVLPLESYVAGVVAGEMPPSWSAEALRAQAVAARTYALTTSAGGSLFDQYPDTRSQVYRGIAGEQASSLAAVQATAGEVVTYRGALATTYFFSTSGGYTENVENVFYHSPPQPYLRGVSDQYEGSGERHRWRKRLTARQLESKLGSLCRGHFRKIVVDRRGVSPRVVSARVVCSASTQPATGVQLRKALGLYDTWFTLRRVTAAPMRPGRAATLVARLLAPPLALSGSFDPPPPSRRVVLERAERRRGG
ncbi:MAG: hypothetical protein NVSMB25_10070 [Thermoleophilaceae bacterium]